MASSRLVFLLAFIVCSFQIVLSENVPVFLWGDLVKTSEKPSYLSVTPEELATIYKEQLVGDPFTLIFAEKRLSAEDFSRKTAEGKSSFPYLQENLGKSLYIPSTEYPIEVLNNIADQNKIYKIKSSEIANLDLEDQRFLFIEFDDIEGEPRPKMLLRHNDLMKEIFTKLKADNERVIAIYTSELPLWSEVEHSRKRRQAEALNEFLLKFNNLLLYARNIILFRGNTDASLGTLVNSNSKYDDTTKVITATLEYQNYVLTMYFSNFAGYWYFNKVDVDAKSGGSGVQEVNNPEVYAIEGFSYRCSQSVRFVSINTTEDYTLVLQDMQVQPFFGISSPSFGDPFYCVGFTSVPIWAGLFVTFLLLAITFYGVMMMMDIRTMDRFDDPKGKTITVSSLE